MEDETGRPRNPMINAGAITTHSLLGAEHQVCALYMPRWCGRC
ncbi:glutaminase [Arthrobacter sp. BL-252-APC-1A]|nr:glutaminase [Arthrobacter sp. BL-252-APC-1A]